MLALKISLSTLSLILLVGLVVALLTPSSFSDMSSIGGSRVVSDLTQLEMLDSDLLMLQQMRNTTSVNMSTMIARDSMWQDPTMIRLQEEYQAQLDRMLGRRAGQQ
jgi:hypothetical protein